MEYRISGQVRVIGSLLIVKGWGWEVGLSEVPSSP